MYQAELFSVMDALAATSDSRSGKMKFVTVFLCTRLCRWINAAHCGVARVKRSWKSSRILCSCLFRLKMISDVFYVSWRCHRRFTRLEKSRKVNKHRGSRRGQKNDLCLCDFICSMTLSGYFSDVWNISRMRCGTFQLIDTQRTGSEWMFELGTDSKKASSIFVLLSVIKPPHIGAESWHFLVLVVGKSIERFSLIAEKKGPGTESEHERKRNTTQYFAFISHICLLSCSRHRRANIKQLPWTIASKAPVLRLSAVFVDKSEPRMSPLVWRAHTDSASDRGFEPILCSHKSLFSIVVLPYSSIKRISNKSKGRCLHLETQFYPTLGKERTRTKERPQLFTSNRLLFSVNWQLKGDWCLHNLTNSCRLIPF